MKQSESTITEAGTVVVIVTDDEQGTAVAYEIWPCSDGQSLAHLAALIFSGTAASRQATNVSVTHRHYDETGLSLLSASHERLADLASSARFHLKATREAKAAEAEPVSVPAEDMNQAAVPDEEAKVEAATWPTRPVRDNPQA